MYWAPRSTLQRVVKLTLDKLRWSTVALRDERGYTVFLDLGSQREAETCGGLGPGSPLVVRAVHVPGQQTEPPAKQVGAGADPLHHQEAGQ